MANNKDIEQRSAASVDMDKLLEKSAEMRARHQQLKEKGEDLKQRTDDFLSEQPDTEPID